MKNLKMIEWTDEKVARLWDHTAENFPEKYFTYQVGRFVVGDLAGYFAGAKTALDYGSGPGFLIQHILDKGIKTAALDFSPKSIEKVNEKYAGNPFYAGGYLLDQLKHMGSTFDVIFIVEVIEHLNDFYLNATVENVKQLLSKNGVAIFTTPNNERLEDSYIYCPESDVVFHRWQHVRNWSVQSISKFMTSNGLDVVDVFATDFTNRVLVEDKRKFRMVKYVMNKIFKYPFEIKLPHLVCVVKNKD